MQIETVAVERLIPYARNSRTHSEAQVAQIAASLDIQDNYFYRAKR